MSNLVNNFVTVALRKRNELGRLLASRGQAVFTVFIVRCDVEMGGRPKERFVTQQHGPVRLFAILDAFRFFACHCCWRCDEVSIM